MLAAAEASAAAVCASARAVGRHLLLQGEDRAGMASFRGSPRACEGGGERGPSSVDLAFGVGPVGLAEFELLDLAGRGARDRLAELHPLRGLVAGDPLAGV